MKALKLDSRTAGQIHHALEVAHETLPKSAKIERHEVQRAMEKLERSGAPWRSVRAA